MGLRENSGGPEKVCVNQVFATVLKSLAERKTWKGGRRGLWLDCGETARGRDNRGGLSIDRALGTAPKAAGIQRNVFSNVGDRP